MIRFTCLREKAETRIGKEHIQRHPGFSHFKESLQIASANLSNMKEGAGSTKKRQ